MQLKPSSPVHRRTPASAAFAGCCRSRTATVCEKRVTETDGSKRTSPGGATAARPVPGDARKAVAA